MSEISRFFGIVIAMHHWDARPAHFHAQYSGQKVIVRIADGHVTVGVRIMFDVVEARYVNNYTVWLRFEDGTEGEVDLSAELYSPVFEPLKDTEFFSQLHVNPDTGTIEWPNRADLAPEFLYEKVHVTA